MLYVCASKMMTINPLAIMKVTRLSELVRTVTHFCYFFFCDINV